MALAALLNIGPHLVDLGGKAWNFASAAADQAAVYWAAAPRECKHALIFAGNICAGVEPVQYYTRGFGPLALGWGWLSVGLLLGLLLGLNSRDIVAALEKYGHRVEMPRASLQIAAPAPLQPPPGLQPMPLWHQAARNALAFAPDGPQRVMLRRLVEDGDAALEFLVASTGASRRAALSRVLGEQVVATNAVSWRL